MPVVAARQHASSFITPELGLVLPTTSFKVRNAAGIANFKTTSSNEDTTERVLLYEKKCLRLLQRAASLRVKME
jgi:hypothetical protein